jgi:glutamate synthase (NADPH/NADH) small chain
MPGSKREVSNAKEEGAIFEFNAQPIAIVHDNCVISGVKFIRTKLVVQENGKSILEHVHGSEFVIEADIVITAFGFRPESMPWLGSDTIDHHGRIKLSNVKTKQFVGGKLYAGGDIVRGASLVVNAVADGMQAARDIVADLNVL